MLSDWLCRRARVLAGVHAAARGGRRVGATSRLRGALRRALSGCAHAPRVLESRGRRGRRDGARAPRARRRRLPLRDRAARLRWVLLRPLPFPSSVPTCDCYWYEQRAVYTVQCTCIRTRDWTVNTNTWLRILFQTWSTDGGAHWTTAGGRCARRPHVRHEALDASSRTHRRCARRRLEPLVPAECAALAGALARRAASPGERPPAATQNGPALPAVLHGYSVTVWTLLQNSSTSKL